MSKSTVKFFYNLSPNIGEPVRVIFDEIDKNQGFVTGSLVDYDQRIFMTFSNAAKKVKKNHSLKQLIPMNQSLIAIVSTLSENTEDLMEVDRRLVNDKKNQMDEYFSEIDTIKDIVSSTYRNYFEEFTEYDFEEFWSVNISGFTKNYWNILTNFLKNVKFEDEDYINNIFDDELKNEISQGSDSLETEVKKNKVKSVFKYFKETIENSSDLFGHSFDTIAPNGKNKFSDIKQYILDKIKIKEKLHKKKSVKFKVGIVSSSSLDYVKKLIKKSILDLVESIDSFDEKNIKVYYIGDSKLNKQYEIEAENQKIIDTFLNFVRKNADEQEEKVYISI